MDTLTWTETTLLCLARVRAGPGAPAWYFSGSQSPPLRSSAPAGRRPGSLHLLPLRCGAHPGTGRRGARWPRERRQLRVRPLSRGDEARWFRMPRGTCLEEQEFETAVDHPSTAPYPNTHTPVPGPGESEARGRFRRRAAARLGSEQSLLSAACLGWGWGRATASSPPQLPSRKSLAPLPQGLEILSNTGCWGSGGGRSISALLPEK